MPNILYPAGTPTLDRRKTAGPGPWQPSTPVWQSSNKQNPNTFLRLQREEALTSRVLSLLLIPTDSHGVLRNKLSFPSALSPGAPHFSGLQCVTQGDVDEDSVPTYSRWQRQCGSCLYKIKTSAPPIANWGMLFLRLFFKKEMENCQY